ncbi:hypothetical protein V6N11_067624 [Hibiscus sabdariffa]|uniref:Uncharacterized protein n=1 Tax=Hibiscus sabdariffa TaxID=183260 RepID=A0ABR2SSA0_9ROSI
MSLPSPLLPGPARETQYLRRKMRGRSILRQAFNVRSFSSTSRIPLTQSNIISAPEKNPSIPKTPSSVWTPRNPNLSRSFSNAFPDYFKPYFPNAFPDYFKPILSRTRT